LEQVSILPNAPRTNIFSPPLPVAILNLVAVVRLPRSVQRKHFTDTLRALSERLNRIRAAAEASAAERAVLQATCDELRTQTATLQSQLAVALEDQSRWRARLADVEAERGHKQGTIEAVYRMLSESCTPAVVAPSGHTLNEEEIEVKVRTIQSEREIVTVMNRCNSWCLI
jgi:septal ring factor EnvC (AmiA/AmiB activator)